MAEFKDLDVAAANNTARFPEGMRVNALNNQLRELEAMVAREFGDRNGSLSSTGSANAYVLAANATLTAYAQGDEFAFKANFANTSGVTIDVDGVGAKSILKAHDQALVTGDIESGALVRIVYDGTNFQLMSPTGFDPASAVASTAADAVSTAADVVSTNADVVTTNADVVLTAADVVSTGNDVTSTNADVVSTGNDVTSTNADAVLTAADVVSAEAAAGAVAVPFTFDNSTTMGDPGTGDFRFNNATVSSVTAIAVDATSADTGNPDVSDFIAVWGASTATNKGYITIKKSGTPATFATFAITAAVTDNTGWLQLTVTHVDSNGTWTAADKGYFAWSRTGDDGAGSYNTATATTEGIVELATQAEVDAGTDTARSITPATLDAFVNGKPDTVITAADEILFADATDSNKSKKDAVQGILDLVPASGVVGDALVQASLASQLNNVTGDNTVYTIVFDTEITDVGGDWASPTFTAPTTGKYLFSGVISIIAGTSTSMGVRLVTSNRTLYFRGNPNNMADSSTQINLPFAAVLDMDASDTASIAVVTSGGAKDDDVTTESYLSIVQLT